MKEGSPFRMRFVLVFALALSAPVLRAQQAPWNEVKTDPSAMSFSKVTPSTLERQSIIKLLKSRKAAVWECETDDKKGEWLDGLIFEDISLSPEHRILLVEAGAGCARGGQGSNGAMWLVQLDGPNPAVLASPDHGFNGWVFSVQSSASHGYKDLVLGWHMGASEAGLNYLRFNGKWYEPIGSATLTTDENDHSTITPNPPST